MIRLCTLLMILLLTALTSSLTAAAQTADKPAITPGEGIGEIKLGMIYPKVVEQLGLPFQRRLQEDERKLLAEKNLDPKRELAFFIGFDYLLEYNIPTNKSELPVYTLYFKENKLVYLVISSYNYDYAKCKAFGINSALFFGDNQEKMRKTLGRSSISIDTKLDTQLYDYLEKGVSLFFQNNELRTVYLYAPLTNAQIRSYRAIAGS